jgi:hypothetical protein
MWRILQSIPGLIVKDILPTQADVQLPKTADLPTLVAAPEFDHFRRQVRAEHLVDITFDYPNIPGSRIDFALRGEAGQVESVCEVLNKVLKGHDVSWLLIQGINELIRQFAVHATSPVPDPTTVANGRIGSHVDGTSIHSKQSSQRPRAPHLSATVTVWDSPAPSTHPAAPISQPHGNAHNPLPPRRESVVPANQHPSGILTPSSYANSTAPPSHDYPADQLPGPNLLMSRIPPPEGPLESRILVLYWRTILPLLLLRRTPRLFVNIIPEKLGWASTVSPRVSGVALRQRVLG